MPVEVIALWAVYPLSAFSFSDQNRSQLKIGRFQNEISIFKR